MLGNLILMKHEHQNAYNQILNNLNNLTHLLNLTVTNESDESEDTQKMSNASIDYGAEIFLFLNMHPSEWQYDFWFDFYSYDDDENIPALCSAV